jgi:SAM-dependent methyltransferase
MRAGAVAATIVAMVSETFDVRDFQAVDASATEPDLVAHLRSSAALEDVARARAELRTVLGVRRGARLLDIGCGLGDEVVAVARHAGPGGLVVGVDASSALLARAQARARDAGVTAHFVLADAHDLPLPDAFFDAVRIERTLQHVADPDAVLAEAARVLAPGGTLGVCEPDWGATTVRGGDPAVCAAIARTLGGGVRNRRIGLELPQRLERAALAVTLVRPGTVQLADLQTAYEVLRLDDAVGAAIAGGLDATAGREWLADLPRCAAGGGFEITLHGYLAAARRPL